MTKGFKTFLRRDDGAVTVDFVVLTAAAVLLALAAASAIGPGVTALGSDIGTDVESVADYTPESLTN